MPRIIDVLEQAQGPDHPDLLWMLVPYARALRLAGEVEAGLQALERALAIAEKTFGTDHIETARVIEGFGYHYYGLRDYHEVLRHFDRALAVRQEVFGPGHLGLAGNLYDRACVLALKGDRAAALESLRGAVDAGWSTDIQPSLHQLGPRAGS